MIGKNLLVAPVVSEYDNFKKLYLPEGEWLDWWHSKVYEGKQWIIVEAPMDQIPLFIREGGIIPVQDKQNYVGEKNISQIKFKIFPAKSSEYDLYEDDGISTNYEKGEFSLTKINIQKKGSSIDISINKSGNYNENLKSFLFDIYDANLVKFVNLNGENISILQNPEDFKKAKEGFYFNKNEKLLSVKVNYSDRMEIQIR